MTFQAKQARKIYVCMYVCSLVSVQRDVKEKLVRRKSLLAHLRNGSSQNIIILNVNELNICASSFITQVILNVKSENDNKIVRAADFNIQLSPTDRLTRQNLKRKAVTLLDIINKILLFVL